MCGEGGTTPHLGRAPLFSFPRVPYTEQYVGGGGESELRASKGGTILLRSPSLPGEGLPFCPSSSSFPSAVLPAFFGSIFHANMLPLLSPSPSSNREKKELSQKRGTEKEKAAGKEGKKSRKRPPPQPAFQSMQRRRRVEEKEVTVSKRRSRKWAAAAKEKRV